MPTFQRNYYLMLADQVNGARTTVSLNFNDAEDTLERIIRAFTLYPEATAELHCWDDEVR